MGANFVRGDKRNPVAENVFFYYICKKKEKKLMKLFLLAVYCRQSTIYFTKFTP